MNATQLLAHFDRLAEAPSAMLRLRDLVLDLAVRGKLLESVDENEQVSSDYSSEPSSDKFPQNWRVLSFGQHFDIQGGTQPPKSSFISEPRDGYVRLFQIRDLGERPVPTYISVAGNIRYCKEGEILVGRYGASVGKVFWAQDGAYNVAMAKVIYPATVYVSRFVFFLLKSSFFQRRLTEVSRSAQAGFNKGDLAEVAFPLPPLPEQHRIVAKVDELMALCDQLEAAQQERERRRERLAAASLQRLNQPAADTTPEAQREHARFHLHHLPRLTTRPEHIKAMRQTILNLAVRGKLVEQDVEDESAADMLQRIKLSTTQPVTSGNPKKVKPLSLIAIQEEPYPAPMGWSWVRMGLIGETNIGLTYSPANLANAGTPVLRSSNVQNGKLDLSDLVRVNVEVKESVLVQEGDLLICARNGSKALVGKTALISGLTEKMAFGAFMAIFRSPYNAYLLRFINSPLFRAMISDVNTTTINQITQENLKSALLPLPPLAEQHRIVAKVDELMALCDQLEAQLTTTQTDSRRLLEAVLEAALTPV